MSGLVVDNVRCIGCGRCVRSCASSGIVLEGDRSLRRARVTDGCVLCGACIDACPVDALRIDRGPVADGDLASWRDIWVVAQPGAEGAPLPVALELVGRARDLADSRGCLVVALHAGVHADDCARAAEILMAAGADRVITCADDCLAPLDAEAWAGWVVDCAREFHPEAILYGATVFGRELAPAVAVRLETGLTADCTMLEIDPVSGLLQQTRPAFGGNLMATIQCPVHRPQMATVRPGVFAAPVPDPSRAGEVIEFPVRTGAARRVRVLAVESDGDSSTVADAEVLVVAGRGVGSRRNLEMIEELAGVLGAKLGCTRPVVEAGWLEPWHQVGQTGTIVSPRILLSFGVSGAIQHLAGISGAETVIAVNDDPDAPIFHVARHRVVGDCMEVARALLDELSAAS